MLSGFYLSVDGCKLLSEAYEEWILKQVFIVAHFRAWTTERLAVNLRRDWLNNRQNSTANGHEKQNRCQG